MALHHASGLTASNILVKLTVPDWAYGIPFLGKIRVLCETQSVFDSLKAQIIDMIAESPSRALKYDNDVVLGESSESDGHGGLGTPFAVGIRSCPGQRFATLEGICFLAHIARRYRISPPLELEHLSRAEQKRTMLAWHWSMSMVPSHRRVTLTLRTHH
ncbi:hypothetical protein DACRYDRAFT_23355 [Dacryopinax primogenitus]|uniref:Cytochrome P450 n=1 Tax=Dacryopinax primogenitus (strain DJM 731) TaxID=1858805 RepID=M5FVU0_DACPD|nr:uncharacterized protein DACRYDRAFT_23355 [Dacryopinax primogenitus]EJU00474.1 hypothetical protein DACRYDRAFT_23355 [Dacryopinax primogenitus]